MKKFIDSEKTNDNELSKNEELQDNVLEVKANKTKKPILTDSELKIRKARKKRFAFAAFVLLLGVGVMGNWYYDNSDLSESIQPMISSSETKTLGEAEFVGATTQPQTENEYFSSARVSRQSARDEQLSKLQDVIDKSEAGDPSREQAEKDIATISSYISIENKIETLVQAKGINNCLAVINEDGSRVDVIVDVSELDDTLIMQIKDIAMEQLGCSFENVSIIQSK